MVWSISASCRFCCCGFWDPKQDPGWILQVQPALGALRRQKLYPSSCCTGRALWGQRACRSEAQKHRLGWALGKLETGMGKVQMLSPRSKVRNIRQKNLNLEKQETSKPSHLSLGCKQKTYEDD
ncbi:hypothetical protein Q9966_010340 [Columba livia]|nr:hypothetical protein Q9966_010340 [Columba livia]